MELSQLLTAVAPTAHGTCVVAGGRVWCWGNNFYGELGAGAKDEEKHPAPRIVPGLDGVDVLWAGSHSLCALRADDLFCWGEYLPGAGTAPSPVAFPLPGAIGPVGAGEQHVCAQTAGRIFCWGVNDLGQLGTGDTAERTAPAAVQPPLGAEAIAATWDSTCALRDGKVLCWGSNRYGKLARATQAEAPNAPQEAGPGILDGGVTQIVGGCDSYCALKGTKVLCWGRNRDCTLGRATSRNADDPLPAEVQGLPPDVVRLVGGDGPCPTHLCALTAGGELWCWGLNVAGQLGIDPAERSTSCAPVRIDGPLAGRKARLAATGRHHTCAVIDEEVWCWGANDRGQLGRETPGSATHVPGVAASPWRR